ncbi:hypothetical protein A4G16_08945 [Mannheimia granulomatis]|uniref:Uncharacterized protein n=1 Tax=Mannheimia granulomatis TaxID=85402 RepID=A0A6G8JK78_9PAST|nr:hypothetical protein [Mannheimia granulomatis]QIM67476.1 hypothetical protein A4G16_08945 [Mannheimia granulomatis]
MENNVASFSNSLENIEGISDLSFFDIDNKNDKAGTFSYEDSKFGFFDSVLDGQIKIGIFTLFLQTNYKIKESLDNNLENIFNNLKDEISNFPAVKVTLNMDNGIFNLDAQIQIPYYESENSRDSIIKAALDMLIIIKARITFFAIQHILE